MMECPKCNLPVDCKTDVFTVCDGSCSKSFHAACVGLPESVVRCISKNLIWLCDECLASFYDHITRDYYTKSESPIDAELAVIKEQIANITEVLSTITPQTSRRDETPSSIQCAPSHSTPISSSRLNRGSKIEEPSGNYCYSLTDDRGGSMAEDNNEKFSLFLTNIDASVTEQDISCMVTQSLGVVETETIEVVKLVPRWKLHESLQYVSFKILLDRRFKRLALQCETWPDGVLFREFTERPRRTWKPARRGQTTKISQQEA